MSIRVGVFGVLACVWILSAADIRVNHLGYHPAASKWVIVTNGATDSFYVRRASDDSVVWRGALSKPVEWINSGEAAQKGDFSGLTAEGLYVIEAKGLGRSIPVRIRRDTYADAYRHIQRAFYYWRASTAIPEEFGGVFKRDMGHPDTSLSYHPDLGKPAGSKRSVARGWYDAGDYGKYVVNAGMSVAMLQLFWAMFPQWSGDSVLNIPESRNGVPDLVDELRWEYDWLFTMQDDDGGVFFKVTPKNFEGNVLPSKDPSQRLIIGKSTTSALNFAGMLAQGSRRFRALDPVFADSCLAKAKRAWEWAKANPQVSYTQGSGSAVYKDVNTGSYGDSYFQDEFFWAAAELYLATRDSAFKQQVSVLPALNIVGWQSVGGLGWYSLALEGPAEDPWTDSARTRVIRQANNLLSQIQSSPYRLPNLSFSWGSNGNTASMAATLLVAFKVSGDSSYIKAAGEVADYLFGKNPLNRTYITGLGYNSPRNPHSRIMVADGVADPIPGYLVGGPNASSSTDNALSQVVNAGCAPASCYVDVYASYAANEIAINWQAPLAFLVGALEAVLGGDSIPTVRSYPPSVVLYPAAGVRAEVSPRKASYTAGEQIRITAAADSPYIFMGWGGSIRTDKADTTITVDKDLVLKPLAILPGKNLVRNGNFTDSLLFWNISRPRVGTPQAQGRLNWDKDSSLKVEILLSGNTSSHIYAVQSGIPLVQGVTYQVELDARSSNLKSINVSVGSGTSVVGMAGLSLGVGNFHYRFSFKMNNPSDENGWIRVEVGGDTASVWIDQVKLYAVVGEPDSAILVNPVLPRGQARSDLAQVRGDWLIGGSGSSYTVEILDLSGSVLGHARADQGQNLYLPGVFAGGRGIYWVRIRDDQAQQIVRWVRRE